MKHFVEMWRSLDVFGRIEWLAVKIVSTAIFLTILYVGARYEITHLLAK